VGDIICIKAGMNVPVDGVIIHSSGVTCSEAAMTGESDEVKKESHASCMNKLEEKMREIEFDKGKSPGIHDVPSSIILSGTTVSTGEGFFLVIMVGKNSCVGKILGKL